LTEAPPASALLHADAGSPPVHQKSLS